MICLTCTDFLKKGLITGDGCCPSCVEDDEIGELTPSAKYNLQELDISSCCIHHLQIEALRDDVVLLIALEIERNN